MIEAMKQALEIAIDYMNERLEDHDCKYQRHPSTEAERINILADIETIKEALVIAEAAVAEQHKKQEQGEPVAWMHPDWPDGYSGFQSPVTTYMTNGWIPLYTTPQQRKPLTDEQIEAKFMKCGGRWNGDHWVIEDADLHPFVRDIESPELNTLRAISDEYNAWIKHHSAGHTYDDFLTKRLAAHGIKE